MAVVDPPATTTPTTSEKLHPATTITNILNSIPVKLDIDTGNYMSWSESFKITCRANDVLHHIIPTTPSTSQTTGDALWLRLDAIVLQWLYNTISKELMETILEKNCTAARAWEILEKLFQDNKHTRAVYLRNKFSNTRLASFPNMTAYCRALKVVSNQLANVDSPVTNQDLVLQLITGLDENYDSVAMLIQQTNPLPDVYDARSKLIMEESCKANMKSNTALLSSTTTPPTNTTTQQPFTPQNQHQYYPQQPSYTHNEQHRSGLDSFTCGRGRSPRGRGRGRGRGRWGGYHTHPNYNNYHHQQSYHQPPYSTTPYPPYPPP